jgi:hypothetical protein
MAKTLARGNCRITLEAHDKILGFLRFPSVQKAPASALQKADDLRQRRICLPLKVL